MASYGIIGLILGFVLGMVFNAILLRDVPKEKYLKDKTLRRRYGLLNWGVALFGLIAGLAIHR